MKIYVPTYLQLLRKLKKEVDPTERKKLQRRIWCRENPDKLKKWRLAYEAKHPRTKVQRRKEKESYYARRYGGGIVRVYNTGKRFQSVKEKQAIKAKHGK